VMGSSMGERRLLEVVKGVLLEVVKRWLVAETLFCMGLKGNDEFPLYELFASLNPFPL
jgi:hypothetical protein